MLQQNTPQPFISPPQVLQQNTPQPFISPPQDIGHLPLHVAEPVMRNSSFEQIFERVPGKIVISNEYSKIYRDKLRKNREETEKLKRALERAPLQQTLDPLDPLPFSKIFEKTVEKHKRVESVVEKPLKKLKHFNALDDEDILEFPKEEGFKLALSTKEVQKNLSQGEIRRYPWTPKPGVDIFKLKTQPTVEAVIPRPAVKPVYRPPPAPTGRELGARLGGYYDKERKRFDTRSGRDLPRVNYTEQRPEKLNMKDKIAFNPGAGTSKRTNRRKTVPVKEVEEKPTTTSDRTLRITARGARKVQADEERVRRVAETARYAALNLRPVRGLMPTGGQIDRGLTTANRNKILLQALVNMFPSTEGGFRGLPPTG